MHKRGCRSSSKRTVAAKAKPPKIQEVQLLHASLRPLLPPGFYWILVYLKVFFLFSSIRFNQANVNRSAAGSRRKRPYSFCWKAKKARVHMSCKQPQQQQHVAVELPPAPCNRYLRHGQICLQAEQGAAHYEISAESLCLLISLLSVSLFLRPYPYASVAAATAAAAAAVAAATAAAPRCPSSAICILHSPPSPSLLYPFCLLSP